ncbi:MAG: PKD domain-containing protein [Chitinophagales bacterium]|nr:PKD domain-containing protein [Chitinophagales bacterium]
MTIRNLFSCCLLVLAVNGSVAQTYYEHSYSATDIHNGRKVLQQPNGDYLVACDALNTTTNKWNTFVFDIAQNGNLKSYITDDTAAYFSSARTMIAFSGQYVVLGNTHEATFDAEWHTYYCAIDSNIQELSPQIINPFVESETYAVVNTPDKGLLLGGYTRLDEPGRRLYVIKLDSLGQMVWDSVYQVNTYLWNSQVVDILPASYHTFYVAGTIDENDTEGHGKMFLMKIDSTGVPLWKREYSTPLGISTARCITRTIDGGLLFVGSIPNPWNYPESTTIIHRLSIGGGLLWSKTFENYLQGGIATRVIALSDGSFVFTGSDYPIPNNASDIGGFILKTDSQGNLLWKRSYGGSDDEYLYDMIANHGDLSGLSGYVICGRTASGLPAGRADMYLLKTNCMGLLTEPQAAFSAQTDTTMLTAAFQNLSQFVYPDSIDGGHYVWEFGDGAVSSEINPTHTYAQAGSYEVKLRAVVCSDTSVSMQNICIGTLEQPVPSFVYSLQNDSLMSFTNTSSNAADAVFIWNFGDGTSSSEQNPTHAYTQAGEHEVRLSVVLCQDTTVFVQVVTTFAVGLPQIGMGGFMVYPNPAQDHLVVENNSLEKSATFVLYDVLGKQVLSVISHNQSVVPIEHLPSGVYVYQFINPQNQIVAYGKVSVVR